MTKQEARERMKILRRGLSDAERKEKNQAIARHLLSHPAMQEISYFFPFVSYGTEVDTRGIIQNVLAEGRCTTAVPKVEGRQMAFYPIASFKDLKAGYQGILEPENGDSIPATEGVMLLPGLAFDRHKNRVGYGGGYYDRYLEQYGGQGILTIALAYEFQVLDKIEAEEFDRKPQWIITENGIF